jgi:hypothetical protein
MFFIFAVCTFLRRSFLFLFHNKVPFIFISLDLLRIIESVPRAFGHCAPVLHTEVSTVSFFCKGRWLQAPALRAVHQTLASVLQGGLSACPWRGTLLYVSSKTTVNPREEKQLNSTQLLPIYL